MEENMNYTEDQLVQMYQDGEITLAEFVVFHPSDWKDKELESALERGDA